MKITKIDKKNGVIKGMAKSFDDLVVLSYIIEKGDKITALSRRKISVNDVKEIKTIKIGLEVESVALEDSSLAVSGKISSSSDENVPLHKYHTVRLAPKTAFLLLKPTIFDFQVNMLKRSQERSPKIFVCVYELGHAIFYRITNQSLSRMYELRKEVSGKRFKNETKNAFFGKLADELSDQFVKRRWDVFIVAGKAMDNEELKKNQKLRGLEITFDTVSYAETGLKELMNNDRINALLKDTKIAIQRSAINEYIKRISAGDKEYVYGKMKVSEAVSTGSIAEALVSRDYVLSNKDVIERLDSIGAKIVFFDEKDDSLDMLNGFGGLILKLV